MLDRVDIIVPTFNNPSFLFPMVKSVMATNNAYPIRLIIVNNGHAGLMDAIPKIDDIKIVQAPDNLGWEGGLKLGLEHSDAKFVMFANDDIFIPQSQTNWVRQMMRYFSNPQVGAIGPTSNVVMGCQQIWQELPQPLYVAPFLIGFCLLLRRSALDAAGGVHLGLPGGDDIDLSIRLRKAGFYLVCDRMTFVYHHGFKTGERVHGTPDQPGGWNSRNKMEETNIALIKKHGFRTWYETLHGTPLTASGAAGADTEGDVVRSLVRGSVLELGCGATKTVPHAIGVDIYGQGEIIPTLGKVSVADIKANADSLNGINQKFDTIIARHILEHLQNPIQAIRHWSEYLNDGGRLILAVPNDEICDTIPMNPEHKHAFTPDYLKQIVRAAGFESSETIDSKNGISFVLHADKVREPLCV